MDIHRLYPKKCLYSILIFFNQYYYIYYTPVLKNFLIKLMHL